MDLRLCMFERRQGLNAKKHDFESDMDLCLCMFRRQLTYGLTFIHVYDFFSACGHMGLRQGLKVKMHEFESDMGLRLCMFQRRWQYGLTFTHI